MQDQAVLQLQVRIFADVTHQGLGTPPSHVVMECSVANRDIMYEQHAAALSQCQSNHHWGACISRKMALCLYAR